MTRPQGVSREGPEGLQLDALTRERAKVQTLPTLPQPIQPTLNQERTRLTNPHRNPPVDARHQDQKPPLSDRLTLSVAEAATMLGIGRATAYECVRTGELPSIKIGGRILIPTKLLNDLLNGEGDARG